MSPARPVLPRLTFNADFNKLKCSCAVEKCLQASSSGRETGRVILPPSIKLPEILWGLYSHISLALYCTHLAKKSPYPRSCHAPLTFVQLNGNKRHWKLTGTALIRAGIRLAVSPWQIKIHDPRRSI